MSNTIEDAIALGVAEILWGDAWATHAEETGCTDLRGTEICSIMPEMTKAAWITAGRIIGQVETATTVPGQYIPHTNMFFLFREVLKLDGINPDHGCIDPDKFLQLAQRFGNCLAYESMGAGVSWEDDHAAVPWLDVPSNENDLHFEVQQACDCGMTFNPETEKAVPECPKCGYFSHQCETGDAGCMHCDDEKCGHPFFKLMPSTDMTPECKRCDASENHHD